MLPLDIALFSATPLQFGGGFETFLTGFRDYAVREGYRCEIVTPPPDQFLHLVRFMGLGRRFRHLETGATGISSIEQLRTARSVYVKNEIVDLAWLRAVRGWSPNVTIGFHTRLHVGNAFRDAVYASPLYRWLTSSAKLHFIRNEQALQSRYQGRQTCVVPNGVPFPSSLSDSSTTFDKARFLYVGRLSYEKGPDRLPVMLSSLNIPWSLRVIGDGPLEPMIREWAGNDPRVTYLGRLDRASVLGEYRQADMLLLPSRWENVPFALLEAVAAGVLPLASDLPEIRDMLAGFPDTILDYDDAAILSEKVEMLAAQGWRRYRQIRTALHTEFKNKYSEDQAYRMLITFMLGFTPKDAF